MSRRIILFSWLAGLALLLSGKLAKAQPRATAGALPTSMAKYSSQLDSIAHCIAVTDSLVNYFDDTVEASFRADKLVPAHPARPSFTTQLNALDAQLKIIQACLAGIDKHSTSSLCQLTRPLVRDYIEALRSYRGAVRALVNGSKFTPAFRYSQYSRASDYLLQYGGSCLQIIQQVRAEQHLADTLGAIRKQTTDMLDSLKRQIARLYWRDSVRFDTLTRITRRVEHALRPYPLPRYLVLAGAYQANAYSLGGLYRSATGHWVASANARYEASARQGGLEGGFGYQVRAFGLLAGPTLQIAPVQLGWKIQVLLLKTGPTLGVAYDSRLGPGVLVAFGW